MENLFPKHKRYRPPPEKVPIGKAIRKKCSSSLHSMDMFGEQINLTYKGRDTFTTLPGSIISLAIILIVLGITVFKFIDLIYRQNPQISQQI